jgi:hypothetical protein
MQRMRDPRFIRRRFDAKQNRLRESRILCKSRAVHVCRLRRAALLI